MSLMTHIDDRTAVYGEIALFRAFREDRVPVPRFAAFFPEMAMVARIFQDLIWALTEIDAGPYAAFAARHRRRDSGHHRWMAFDLEQNGFPPATLDGHYQQDFLPSRVQMARILALTHQASPEARMVILAALESAGEVTLGTLHSYAVRHDLLGRTRYLGAPHMRIEETQVGEIDAVAHDLLQSDDPALHARVDTVFDALTTLFEGGGRRYYAELLAQSEEAA